MPSRRRAPGSSAGLQAIEGWHKMQDTYALLGTVAIVFLTMHESDEYVAEGFRSGGRGYVLKSVRTDLRT